MTYFTRLLIMLVILLCGMQNESVAMNTRSGGVSKPSGIRNKKRFERQDGKWYYATGRHKDREVKAPHLLKRLNELGMEVEECSFSDMSYSEEESFLGESETSTSTKITKLSSIPEGTDDEGNDADADVDQDSLDDFLKESEKSFLNQSEFAKGMEQTGDIRPFCRPNSSHDSINTPEESSQEQDAKESGECDDNPDLSRYFSKYGDEQNQSSSHESSGSTNSEQQGNDESSQGTSAPSWSSVSISSPIWSNVSSSASHSSSSMSSSSDESSSESSENVQRNEPVAQGHSSDVTEDNNVTEPAEKSISDESSSIRSENFVHRDGRWYRKGGSDDGQLATVKGDCEVSTRHKARNFEEIMEERRKRVDGHIVNRFECDEYLKLIDLRGIKQVSNNASNLYFYKSSDQDQEHVVPTLNDLSRDSSADDVDHNIQAEDHEQNQQESDVAGVVAEVLGQHKETMEAFTSGLEEIIQNLREMADKDEAPGQESQGEPCSDGREKTVSEIVAVFEKRTDDQEKEGQEAGEPVRKTMELVSDLEKILETRRSVIEGAEEQQEELLEAIDNLDQERSIVDVHGFKTWVLSVHETRPYRSLVYLAKPAAVVVVLYMVWQCALAQCASDHPALICPAVNTLNYVLQSVVGILLVPVNAVTGFVNDLLVSAKAFITVKAAENAPDVVEEVIQEVVNTTN